MKRIAARSLIVKLSITVVVIESLALAFIGGYYYDRFEKEIDQRIAAQISIPGVLMDRQLLRYEAITDREMIAELVDEELVDALVIGPNHKVFYALNVADTDKHITEIPDFDPRWLAQNASASMTFHLASQGETFLVSITPLRAYAGADPFFFVYLKVNTSLSETQKASIQWFFALGSVLCVVFTSIGMITSLKTIVISPLRQLEDNAKQITQGNLHQAIEMSRQDEVGVLALCFRQMRDAIRQKIAELQELNNTLEQKVDIRTRELKEYTHLLQQEISDRRRAEMQLQQAKEAAEAANRAKSTFLATMSHELRTPLNGILGYAQILRRKRGVDKAQRDGLQVIYSSGQHLLTLINDILDLAKIESGKLQLYPERVNLPVFLDGVAGVMRMSAHHKHLRFVYDAAPNLPAGVECDQKRLRQVLLNLLGNAVKFTESGGTVTFEVSGGHPPASGGHPPAPLKGGLLPLPTVNSPLEGGQGGVLLQFSIKDTGVGMTPEQMQTIFAPFEQVGDVKKRAEGTGLGLTITRQLVKLMGGDIRVESEPGRGSTFSFEIPVPLSLHDAQPDPRRREHRHIIGYAGDAHTLLVVDDLPENRSVLLDLLAPLGFRVLLAENGQQGLEQASAHHPDLILTDLVMPVMDGFEMVKRIRHAAALRDVPIIAVSASTYTADEAASLDIGCQAFLPKPVDVDRLYAVIAEHLGIAWTYETTEDVSQAIEPAPPAESDIIPPPQADLEALYELTMFGNLQRVREKADALAQQDAQYRAFAHIIRAHAEKLEDEPILELVTRYITQA